MTAPNDSNGSIELDRTIVKLVDGPSCPAQVVLRLSPLPTMLIEPIDPSTEFQEALIDAFLKQGRTVVELPLGQRVPVLINGQSLIPESEPVTAIYTGKPLHAVRFGLVNFPDFMKPRTTESPFAKSHKNINNLWTIHLEGAPWLVEIRPVGNRRKSISS